MALAEQAATAALAAPTTSAEVVMEQFDHEKLDAYQIAVDWIVLAHDLAQALPRGKGNLADQLQRAASSIALNIAEGAGEFSAPEKARFYRMAKRSATECAAVLDVAKRRSAITDQRYAQSRSLLLRIVGMLVKLVRAHS
jgi:four helix bundle protein